MKTTRLLYPFFIWIVCMPFFQLQAQQPTDLTSCFLKSAKFQLSADTEGYWERDTLLIDMNAGDGQFLHYKVFPTYDEQERVIKIEQKIISNHNEQVVENTWEDSYQSSRSYDDRGNMLTDISFKKESNQWIKNINIAKTYDKQNHIIAETWLKGINDEWVNNIRYTFTYDEKGNKLTSLNESWNNNSWEKSVKITYTYDEKNNLLSEFWQTGKNNEWLNGDKCTFVYDFNNNLLSKSKFIFDSPLWKNTNRQEYTYDNMNNMLSETYLIGNESGEDWENSEKSIYIYSELNKPVEVFQQKWMNGKWETEIHTVSSYNNHGYLTQDQNENQLTSFMYDANNNLIETIAKYREGDQWIDYSRRNFTYDSNGNCILAESRALNMADGTWFPMNVIFHDLTYNNGKSKMSLGTMFRVKIDYHKIGSVTAIDPVKNDLTNEIKLSPNPAVDYLNIDYIKNEDAPVLIQFYNFSGSLIKQISTFEHGIGQFRQLVDVSSFSKGIYIVEIKIGNSIIKGKFIKI